MASNMERTRAVFSSPIGRSASEARAAISSGIRFCSDSAVARLQGLVSAHRIRSRFDRHASAASSPWSFTACSSTGVPTCSMWSSAALQQGAGEVMADQGGHGREQLGIGLDQSSRAVGIVVACALLARSGPRMCTEKSSTASRATDRWRRGAVGRAPRGTTVARPTPRGRARPGRLRRPRWYIAPRCPLVEVRAIPLTSTARRSGNGTPVRRASARW